LPCFPPTLPSHCSQQPQPDAGYHRCTVLQTAWAVHGTWAPQTKVWHNRAWVRFDCWCNKSGVPKDKRLPASKLVICAFAASHLSTASGATAHNNIVGVWARHMAIGTPWHDGPQLKLVLKGIECAQPASSRQPKQLPTTVNRL
jgi:hypothetical protein